MRVRAGRVIAALLLLGGCKDQIVVERDLTGIELTILYDPASGIDQIQISGTTPDGSEAFVPGRLPETPRALSEGENSAVILLPDSIAGIAIDVLAEGLAGGAPIMSAEVSVTPVLRQLVSARVELGMIVPFDCTDADGDRFGVGKDCMGPDCNDADPTRAASCTGECVDPDGDGYGEGSGCNGPDCDQTSNGCTVDCSADSDADSVPDCRDPCLDPDGDEYGMGTSCLGLDCTETSTTCNQDCTTDADTDLIMDCGDTCFDADHDGYGLAGAAGNTCLDADCDDLAGTCTNDCATDADSDTLSDCKDPCFDLDGDGYGMTGIGGACLGADCDDGRRACNLDCVACLPTQLQLTSDSPRPACTDATLSVDLGAYDGAANDLACSAQDVVVLPLEDFSNGFGRWSTVSNANEVAIHTFPDGFPVSCDTQSFAWIDERGPDYFQLGTPLDTTNLENLMISARVGFSAATVLGDNLNLQACCGAGCTPATFFVFLNGNSLGTDDCTDRTVALPGYASNCPSLLIRFSFPNARGVVGVDNISLTGDVSGFDAFTETSTGTYQSSFRVCEPTTVPVTCTWDDGTNAPLSGMTDVLFE